MAKEYSTLYDAYNMSFSSNTNPNVLSSASLHRPHVIEIICIASPFC